MLRNIFSYILLAIAQVVLLETFYMAFVNQYFFAFMFYVPVCGIVALLLNVLKMDHFYVVHITVNLALFVVVHKINLFPVS